MELNLPFLKKNDIQVPAKVKFKRKDINFFEIKKGVQKSTSADFVLLVIPLGIVCIMGAVYGFNAMRLNNLESAYTKAENELKSFDLKTKQPILEKYTLTRDMLATYNSWVGALNDQLRYYKTVDSDIIDSIIKETNGLVECNDVTFKAGTLSFTGTAMNISDISKFQKKCEDLGILDDLFVKSITKETVDKEKSKNGKVYDIYKFVMTANFKSFANKSEPEKKSEGSAAAAPSASPAA